MDVLGELVPWLIVPTLGIALGCQLCVQVLLGRAGEKRARLSGYAAARQVLDGSGWYDVAVEQVPGQSGGHYDRRRQVLQLSPDVYHGRTLAAVGLAAHEAGHAIQGTAGRAGRMLRELAVPAATFGSGGGILLAIAGLLLRIPPFLTWGLLLFSVVVLIELANLPIEFGASTRGRHKLVELGLVAADDEPQVRRVMWAAAIYHVGATLQSLFTLAQVLGRVVRRPRPGT
ncbi:MAG: zinc metallopeptidase [Pirellulaceae bacterium]|nr:zinc metallopeptidase [Pirellulaceae bacterium]